MANASSILAFTSIISYGIATKRILDITSIFRKVVAYTLLSIYLAGLYLIVWWATSRLFFYLGINLPLASQLLAGVTTAFAMAPANGLLQRFTNKLIASKAMDVSSTMKKAGGIFQTMSTVNDLFDYFAELLVESLGAENIHFLCLEETGFEQSYPRTSPDQRITIAPNSPLAEMIRKENEPISLDSLVRGRQAPGVQATTQELKQLDARIAVGIFSKSQLSGIVLFGERRSGRIYDKLEQDALQILCNQFAVALENAQMYTEMQDSRIRNEILLDELVSGVVLADPNRRISLINHEAQRITGLSEKEAIGQEIDILPKPLFQALENTLTKKAEVRNIDATLPGKESEDSSEHIRMGSAYLLGHDEKPMGALLVFTSITELKTLEEQVRRADQLSSVGTLAAGMAHEIKNPLVTIKTFAQLLPERYSDNDFRSEFSTLVAQEVSRIDGIVNQLLSYSKPAQPHLVPMNLHNTVEQTLKLIHEQLSQKGIELKQNLHAKHDLISGDADLLIQTLVNLGLNAIDAINGTGGSIRIETTNCTYRFAKNNSAKEVINASCIRLQVTDTGKGIAPEQIKKIFDPFFTSKSEGTGMGLSVAHGIIQEHHGAIEVRSKLGKGSSFLIYLPLLKENPA